MGFKHTFTAASPLPPHWPSVLQSLRQTDPTAGLMAEGLSAEIDKDTPWTTPQINGAQTVIDAAPRDSPQLQAQFQIDNVGILERAFFLTLVDQINVLRQAAGLSIVTPGQALSAVRAKAATLS